MSKPDDRTSLSFATGASTGTFKIADRKFHQRAMLIREVNTYLMPDTEKQAYVIDRLNDRIADRGEPIDAAWLENNLTYAEFGLVTQLLLSGSVARPN